MPDFGNDRSVNFASDTIRLYWSHVRKNKRDFFLAALLIPLSALMFATITPYFLSDAIARIAESKEGIEQSIVLALASGAVGVLFNYIGFLAIVRHESHMMSVLINDTAQKLIHKDVAFFSNQKIGALANKYIEFIGSYIKIQDTLIVKTLSFIVSMGIGITLIAKSSLLLASLLLVFTIFILLEIRITMKIRTPYRKKRKEVRSQIIGEVADALTNNVVVKTFAKEKRELQNTLVRTREHEILWMKDIGIVAREGTLRNAVTILFQIMIIGIAILMLRKNMISLGALIFSLTYLQRVATQIFTLGDIVNGYDNAFLEASPMTRIILTNTTVNDKPGAKQLNLKRGAIDFKGVDYSYEDDKTVIENLSINIKPGEKVGFVGPSGAGKTTITKLLLRFDDVDDGSIEIDGQDISLVTQKSLRESIAYVPQEPMLFHRSLLENIGYADDRYKMSKVKQAAKLAHAHEFIKDLPEGYETLVGERGVKLSGGQRQRVAIARAILKDAPILVLDEATSALDSESEKLIQDALGKLMEGRTTLVIAHRLSTIQKMDRIVVLDKGKIVEEGSHSQLLAKKGTYARLWAHQSGGFIEE